MILLQIHVSLADVLLSGGEVPWPDGAVHRPGHHSTLLTAGQGEARQELHVSEAKLVNVVPRQSTQGSYRPCQRWGAEPDNSHDHVQQLREVAEHQPVRLLCSWSWAARHHVHVLVLVRHEDAGPGWMSHQALLIEYTEIAESDDTDLHPVITHRHLVLVTTLLHPSILQVTSHDHFV